MRKLISSGSQFEPRIGFSRAVRVGPIVAVSGTAPISADGSVAAALSVSQPVQRLLQPVRESLPAILMETAERISSALGYRPQ